MRTDVHNNYTQVRSFKLRNEHAILGCKDQEIHKYRENRENRRRTQGSQPETLLLFFIIAVLQQVEQVPMQPRTMLFSGWFFHTTYACNACEYLYQHRLRITVASPLLSSIPYTHAKSDISQWLCMLMYAIYALPTMGVINLDWCECHFSMPCAVSLSRLLA